MDETNLFHVNMQEAEDISLAHECLQAGVINKGKLLLATGGALKPAKCSYYLLLFKWK